MQENIWKKIGAESSKIKDKEKYTKLFLDLIDQIKSKKYEFKEGIEYKSDHYIIGEERLGGYFIYFVPEDMYIIFRKIQEEKPNSMLGSSILCGKYKGKDLRASCFGMPFSDINKLI